LSTDSRTIPHGTDIHKIYVFEMRYTNMAKHSDELIRISKRMMGEHGEYYKDSKKYLNSVMRAMKQEDLIDALQDLNIHEIKECLSAGVPGDAMHVANLRLKEQKAEIRAYVTKKGAEAHASTDVEIA